MKESIRLFVAAALPENLKEKLQETLSAFAHPAARVIPAGNLHLTLYFIGNVPLQELATIKEKVREAAQRHPGFILTLAGTEAGPKPKQPRLVWARFEANSDFEKLSQDLTQTISSAPPEKRKAIPHITLARFRKDLSPPQNLPFVSPQQPLPFAVQEIALWQSEPASPHPVYTILEIYPLLQNPQPENEV